MSWLRPTPLHVAGVVAVVPLAVLLRRLVSLPRLLRLLVSLPRLALEAFVTTITVIAAVWLARLTLWQKEQRW